MEPLAPQYGGMKADEAKRLKELERGGAEETRRGTGWNGIVTL